MLPDEAVKIPGKQKLTKDADRRTIALRWRHGEHK
jgi:hypothetical protein